MQLGGSVGRQGREPYHTPPTYKKQKQNLAEEAIRYMNYCKSPPFAGLQRVYSHVIRPRRPASLLSLPYMWLQYLDDCEGTA
jgi:hypothetical protein